MEMDVIRQLEEQMKIFGIQVIRLRTGDPEETEFDLGLRRALGIRRDSGADLKMMADLLEEDTLYFIRDVFGVHYICLRLPGQDAGDETACFLHIGPYLTGDRETVWEETVKKSDLSVCQRQELRHYYDRLPLPASEEELERLVILQTGYLLGNSDVSINRLENFYGAQMRPKDVLVENDSELSIKMVEERYQQEEWLLQAIRRGDLENTFECVSYFEKRGLYSGKELTLRKMKNLMISSNTLFRKAVQAADVHPVYIHQLSEDFAERIEQCATPRQLEELGREMRRKYCLLVRNHSLKQYSSVVQETINYINIHLREDPGRGRAL